MRLFCGEAVRASISDSWTFGTQDFLLSPVTNYPANKQLCFGCAGSERVLANMGWWDAVRRDWIDDRLHNRFCSA